MRVKKYSKKLFKKAIRDAKKDLKKLKLSEIWNNNKLYYEDEEKYYNIHGFEVTIEEILRKLK